MKLGRRQFFGLSAGAAMAAPSVARDIVAKRAGGPTPPMYMGTLNYGGSLQTNNSDAEYDAARLKEFVAQELSLGKTPTLNQRDWMPIEAARIDGLRSVSASSKARMIIEYQEHREMASRKSWLAEKIAELRKRVVGW